MQNSLASLLWNITSSIMQKKKTAGLIATSNMNLLAKEPMNRWKKLEAKVPWPAGEAHLNLSFIAKDQPND